jgi:cell division protein FtsB
MARRRASTRRTNLRRSLLLLGVVLVGYLYYHPLRTYFDTKHDLAGRSAEVRSLQSQKRKLERQLRESGTPQALAREARMQLSLVKPGEQLFIVKGIDAWRRAQHPAK